MPDISEELKDPKFSISRTLAAKMRTHNVFSTVLGISAVFADIRISMGTNHDEYLTPKSKVLTKGSHESLKKAIVATQTVIASVKEQEKVARIFQHLEEKKWFNLIDAMICIPDSDQIKDYKSFDYWINRYIRHITKTLTN